MSNDIERGASPQRDEPEERGAGAANGGGDGSDEPGVVDAGAGSAFTPFAPRTEQAAGPTAELPLDADRDASFDPYSPGFGRPRSAGDRGPESAQRLPDGDGLPGPVPPTPPQPGASASFGGGSWSARSPEQPGAPAPAPNGAAGIPAPSAFGLGASSDAQAHDTAPGRYDAAQPAASSFPAYGHGTEYGAAAWSNAGAAPTAGAYAAAPAGGLHAAGASPTPRAPRSRAGSTWIAVMASALLAAGLASGGTYAAVTAADGAGSSVSQTSSPVVQQASTGTIDWATVASAVKSSVVSIVTESSQASGAGSGVVWDDQGHIVTNYHVVADARNGGSVRVLVDNTAYSAEVVGSDPTTDLAVLELDGMPDGLTPITRGDSTALSVGQEVMAVGNPLGLSGSVTTGIVSALDRPVTTGATQDSQVVTNAIQTSAPLNPGNSGGALVDASGRLIGINSAIATLGGSGGDGSSGQSGSIGIGFAIPVSQVENIVDQLVRTGSAQHAMLGASAKDGSAQQGPDTVLGAQIASVQPGSAAASAGIQAGDLVTAVDDKPISSTESLIATIREHRPGEQATITVIRGGQRLAFTVTLGSDASGG